MPPGIAVLPHHRDEQQYIHTESPATQYRTPPSQFQPQVKHKAPTKLQSSQIAPGEPALLTGHIGSAQHIRHEHTSLKNSLPNTSAPAARATPYRHCPCSLERGHSTRLS